jgi:UDP-glucose 4-epimerase
LKILLTGGAGYLGSHILLKLLGRQSEVLVLENFCNSSETSLRHVEKLSNRAFDTIVGDIRDVTELTALVGRFQPDCVIHCAGLKAVGESQEKPIEYYTSNVQGSLNLLRAMDWAGCRQIIFSSSATVYGVPQYLPIDENHPVNPVNVYGRTKAIVEELIRDWAAVDPRRSATLLRYFNPVGAHQSGEIGEDPSGIPNNLVPFIADVACEIRPNLSIFGDDYDTPDGTGVRDYIHVDDLAEGHLAAMDYLQHSSGVDVFNLGTGQGYSVVQIVQAFEAACGKAIPYKIAPRRDGDVAASFANPDRARRVLGWQTKLGLTDMCADVWRWRSKYPTGFDGWTKIV